MAQKDLITTARAQDALGGPTANSANLTLSANELTTLADLITSVSDAIEKYCRRRFVSTSFDELYDGSGDRRLLLRQYPIQKVDSVRYRPVTVLKITNTTVANVQARAIVTSTGISLVRVSAGVKTTEALQTFAANVSLSALATAINAIGNGWSAQYVGDANNYGGWPSADLYVPGAYGDTLEGVGTLQSQGALQCVAGSYAELKMHTYELSGYQWDARGWLLRAIPYTDPDLLHPEDLVFPPGINNFRVQYTAGYSTVPEAVQEACAEWVAQLFWRTKRDPLLLHQLPSGGTAQAWGTEASQLEHPPPGVRALLAPYRRYSIGTGQS